MSRVAKPTTPMLFVAAKPDGGRSFGVRRARDERHLSEQLRKDRLVPLRSYALPGWASTQPSEKTPLKDQAELHLQLSQLLNRGVPLVEALDVTSKSVAPNTRPKVEKIRDLVAAGAAFSDACGTVGMFDVITTAVYRASERTGDLAGAAKQLSTTARRQLAISGKVGTLLIYPAIVLSLSLIISVFMVAVIVPRIGKTLEQSGAELPWFTRAIMGVGNFINTNWILCLIALLVAIAAGVFARKRILATVMTVARKVPLFKDVIVTQESARFFTVMAAMTKSGIPLADALGVAVGAVSHPELSKQLTHLRTRLIEGGVLRTLIDGVTSLPVPTRRLMIAAERSGDLESAFEVLGGDMVDDLERKTTRLLAVLEPLLIVVMFLIIGTLLMAIFVPLISGAASSVA